MSQLLLLAGIPGVGKIIASAIVASVPDPQVFKSARDFAAWLGSCRGRTPPRKTKQSMFKSRWRIEI